MHTIPRPSLLPTDCVSAAPMFTATESVSTRVESTRNAGPVALSPCSKESAMPLTLKLERTDKFPCSGDCFANQGRLTLVQAMLEQPIFSHPVADD